MSLNSYGTDCFLVQLESQNKYTGFFTAIGRDYIIIDAIDLKIPPGFTDRIDNMVQISMRKRNSLSTAFNTARVYGIENGKLFLTADTGDLNDYNIWLCHLPEAMNYIHYTTAVNTSPDKLIMIQNDIDNIGGIIDTINTIMTNETTLRTQGQTNLQANINTLNTAMTAGFTFDGLNIHEAVVLINKTITDLNTETNIVTQNTNDIVQLGISINTETSARLIADNTLQSHIDSNKASVTASIATINTTLSADAVLLNNLQTNINTEITDRTLSDSHLQANIDTINTTLASDAEILNNLQTNINRESSNRKSAYVSLQSNIETETLNRENAINSEITARNTADILLQSNINMLTTNFETEVSNRSTTEVVLQGNISAEITNRINAVTVEALARVGDTTNLQNNINTLTNNLATEISNRNSAESILQNAINLRTEDLNMNGHLIKSPYANSSSLNLNNGSVSINLNFEEGGINHATSTILFNNRGLILNSDDLANNLQAIDFHTQGIVSASQYRITNGGCAEGDNWLVFRDNTFLETAPVKTIALTDGLAFGVGSTDTDRIIGLPISGSKTAGNVINWDGSKLAWATPVIPPSTFVTTATGDLDMTTHNISNIGNLNNVGNLNVNHIVCTATNTNIGIDMGFNVLKNVNTIQGNTAHNGFTIMDDTANNANVYGRTTNAGMTFFDRANNFENSVMVATTGTVIQNTNTNTSVSTILKYDNTGNLTLTNGNANITNAGKTTSGSFKCSTSSGLTFSDNSTLTTSPVKTITLGDNLAYSVGSTNTDKIIGLPISGIKTTGNVVSWNGANLAWATPSSGGGFVGQSTTDLNMLGADGTKNKITNVSTISSNPLTAEPINIIVKSTSLHIDENLVSMTLNNSTTATTLFSIKGDAYGVNQGFSIENMSDNGIQVNSLKYNKYGNLILAGTYSGINAVEGNNTFGKIMIAGPTYGNYGSYGISFPDGSVQTTAYTGSSGGGGGGGSGGSGGSSGGLTYICRIQMNFGNENGAGYIIYKMYSNGAGMVTGIRDNNSYGSNNYFKVSAYGLSNGQFQGTFEKMQDNYDHGNIPTPLDQNVYIPAVGISRVNGVSFGMQFDWKNNAFFGETELLTGGLLNASDLINVVFPPTFSYTY